MMRSWPDVEVVAEAATVDEARDTVNTMQPDVLLLDIQLHKRTGFELLEALDVDPHVVFVTAYAHHAVRAFEVSAVDYLLKPVDTSRLREALDRARSRRARPGVTEVRSPDDVLLIKNGRRYHFVSVERVLYIEAHGEYSDVHAETASGLSNRRLSDWEAMLPRDRFMRIHRSTIANLHYIETMTPSEGTNYELRLRATDARLTVSRRYAAKIRAMLS